MRICIYGLGGIGGVLAAKLALAGRPVAAVARGARLDAIRSTGLAYEHDGQQRRVRLPVSDEPRDLGAQDLVVCCTKSFSLPAVAERMGPLLHDRTTVVFAVNGIPWWYFQKMEGPLTGRVVELVDPGGGIRDAIGAERALGCTVYIGASVADAGSVTQTTPYARLILGELSGALTPRLEAVSRALALEDLEIRTTARIRDEVWSKLMANVAFNPLAALTGATVDRLLADPRTRGLAVSLMEELAAVAQAIGATLPATVEEKLRAYDRMGPVRPSTLQDVEAGRPLEIDAILGAVGELGRLVRVPTPMIDATYALCRRLAEERGLYPAIR